MLTPTEVLYPAGEVDQVVADVDWATGIVRMSIAYDSWQRIVGADASRLSDNERYLLEVVSHEAMHVMQMVTTGFAYELSLECFEHVASALRNTGDLDGVYRVCERHAAALEPVLGSLAVRGENGVRTLDLLESSAFLFQKRVHHPELGPRSYETMLAQQAPDAAYRRAYDLAADVLGEDAFDHLAHIATLALQTREPQTVFQPMLEAFESEASRIDVERNHRIGVELLNEQFADILLGHPLERAQRGRVHPVLAGIMRAYNELAFEDKIRPIVMMARPWALDQSLADLLVGPMLFPPPLGRSAAAMYVPRAWSDRAEGDPFLKPDLLRLICAASALVLMDVEPIPPEPPEVRSRSAGYDQPITMRNWVFSRENQTAATADRLEQNLSTIEMKASTVRMLRATVAISFPGEEYDDSPYLGAHVRNFLFGIYERVPHLLYYLAESTEASSMLGCVAAHAPDDAVSREPDGGIAVEIDMRTIPALFARVQAAASFARRMGDDPRALLGHFGGLEPALRQALEQVALDPDLA